MGGWGEHNGVLEESGFREYRVDMNLGLNYPSIKNHPSTQQLRYLSEFY